jgi:hypothetical protein
MRVDLYSLAETGAITAFPFNNILASPRLSRNPFIFKPSSRSTVFHFLLPFVFNNSSRSTFIFNISSGAGALFDFRQQIGDPPHIRRAPARERSPCHSRESGNLRAPGC